MDIKETTIKFLNLVEKVGVRINNSEHILDASRLQKVGIKTLGKLDFLRRLANWRVVLPSVDYDPAHGYKGLSHP